MHFCEILQRPVNGVILKFLDVRNLELGVNIFPEYSVNFDF